MATGTIWENIEQKKISASFPSEFDNPKDKQKEQWGLKYAQAAWEQAKSSGYGYFESNKATWIRNRKFAEGLHDIDAYKKRAIPGEKDWVTLNYTVGTPAPKIIRIIISRILDHPYRPKVTLGDSYVQTKLDKKKNEVLGKMSLKNMLIDLKNQDLLPDSINPSSLGDVPTDPADLEMYFAENAQLPVAVVMNKLIRNSFKNNKIRNIEERVVNDLVKLKMGAVYCSIDEDYQFKAEYIDPIRLVTSYCDEPDYSDWKHIGHWEDVTVSEFRKVAGQKFTDEQIFQMVKNSPSQLPGYMFGFNHEKYYDLTEHDKLKMEGEKIRLFHFECLQSDRKVYREKEGEDGYLFFDEKSPDYELDENAKNQKVLSGAITKIYHGTWIVGSNHMLKWGLKPNVIRKIRGKKFSHTPECSYIIRQPNQYEMRNKSVQEEMIPHIELMIIYSIKIQHFVALAAPPGTEIDVASQAAVMVAMGFDGLKPKALIDLYRQTGIKYFSSIREDGTPIVNTRPIHNIPSTIDQGIIHLAELYNMELAKIKEIAGVNDAVDSSTPDSRRLKGVMQQAAQAFNTTIQELTDNYLSMVEEIASRAAYHQMIAIQSDKETEEIRELLSESELAIMKEIDFGEIGFNTHIEMLPDKFEIEQILMDMANSIKQGSLTIPDSIAVRRALREGNTDKAELILMQKMREKQRADEQIAEAEAARQSELIQQSAEAEMQKSQQEAQAKMEAEIAKLKALQENIAVEEAAKRETVVLKGEINERMLRLAHELKMEAMMLGAGYDSERDSIPNEAGGEPQINPSSRIE